jgi:hypothetical protein
MTPTNDYAQRVAVHLYIARQPVQVPRDSSIREAFLLVLRDVHHLTPEQALYAWHTLANQTVATDVDLIGRQVDAAVQRALQDRPL